MFKIKKGNYYTSLSYAIAIYAVYCNCYCDQLNYYITEIPLGDIVFHRTNIPYLYDVIACIKDIVSKENGTTSIMN